jgi:hypothetical protein
VFPVPRFQPDCDFSLIPPLLPPKGVYPKNVIWSSPAGQWYIIESEVRSSAAAAFVVKIG